MNILHLYTFTFILVCLFTTIKGDTTASCCVKKDIPDKCHYLCNDDDDDVSWQTTLTCTIHRVTLATCKIDDAFDLVELFGKDFQKTKKILHKTMTSKISVENGWNDLSDALKKSLSTAQGLATMSVDQIKSLHQDMLSALHKSLNGMTNTQFRGIMSRLKDFTTENLKKIADRVNVDLILNNAKDLASYAWDRSQIAVLAHAAYKKFGENVSTWSAEQIEKLGDFIVGLPSSEFAKFSVNALDKSLAKLCAAKTSYQQKLNTLIPAKSLFGDISQWNSSTITRMCNFVEALTVEEILEMQAEELSKALPALKNRLFTKEQRDAIIKKLQETWGKLSTWSTTNLQKLGEFVQSIDVDELKELDAEKLKELVKEYGVDAWDEVQKSEVLKQLLAKIDSPANWPEDILLKSVNLLNKVNVDELKNISKASLIKALEYGTKMDWSQEQAQVLLQIVKGEKTDFSVLTEDDIKKMGSYIKAFLASDAGKFSKRALYLAFPEMIPVVGLGEPLIRYFIQVYKEESKNGEIKTLGQFVKALTRYDLSKEQIEDILGNLEELTDTEFNEAQIAELMIKLRTKLGNMNTTTSNDDDVLPWGFQNLRKMGKIVLGFTRKELKDFPMRGIEDSMEVLGKQDGWKRRMVLTMYKRMKEFWEANDISINQLSEANILALGKFVQGLSLDELKSLGGDAKMAAIEALGKYTGLPEDKLKSRANYAYNYLKELNGGKISASELKLLGNLIHGLSKDLINQVDKEIITNNLPILLKDKSLTLENLKEIVGKVKDYLQESDVGKWSVDQLRKLGIALKTLSIDDIKALSKDTFDSLMIELGKLDWNTQQLNELIKKAKEKYGDDVSKWSEKVFHRLGGIINGLNDVDVDKITKETFEKMIGQFGAGIKLAKHIQTKLAEKFKTYILSNNFTNFDVNIARRFSNLLSALSVDNLKKINIDSKDLLDVLGQIEDWSPEQATALAEKARQYLSSQSNVDKYTSLKNLIKGMTSEDIKDIADEGFKYVTFSRKEELHRTLMSNIRYAAGFFGQTTGLSTAQKKALVEKAKSAWGNDVSTWSSGMINEAGKFLDGMSSDDLKKLNPNTIPHIQPTVISGLENNQVQSLTEDQLSELSEEQVNAFTSDQKAVMSEPQLAKLTSIKNEDPNDPDPYDGHTGSSIINHVATPLLLLCVTLNIMFAWLY